ncbi:MIP/aquaporin family protein [Granulicatella seriolae]|uniref:Aquaporin family protein n=1 Tax=Granulicatella seriolae TaxID=2967226 RepID=A0ABT1WM22_9LACT|nr:MIP/aquaporin family protein [Granulicatella seriolae]
MGALGTELLGEFIGTAVLILLGNGVVAGVLLKDTKSNNAGWVAITMGWGIAVAVAAFIAGFMSPAHLNPAVSIGLAINGSFPWASVGPYIVAQFLGAIFGAFLVWLQYKPHYDVTEDKGAILGTFATGPAIYQPVANVISEAIGTFILVFGILAFGKYDMPVGLGTLVVGTLIVGIGLSLGGTTGYAINPARDLGPRIAHFFLPMKNKGNSDWKYAWIPVVGPILGGALAGLLFTFL